MNVKKRIILNRMFEHACAFSDCAELCEKETSFIKHRLKSHTVSGIVNSAFACEIYIKMLLVYYGTPIRSVKEHDLSKLWEMLKRKKPNITQRIEKKMSEWYNFRESNFDVILSRVADSFEKWRYVYELQKAAIDINFLKGFRILLREACCRKLHKQSWKEYIAGQS